MEPSLNMIPLGIDALTIHLFHSSMKSCIRQGNVLLRWTQTPPKMSVIFATDDE
jgi:hypothetical protein